VFTAHLRKKKNSMVIVLMGVSGSGKTTIGKLLSAQLGWEFADGDDYHPAENIEKMRSGEPLTDADRAPWLERLRSLIEDWGRARTNGVLVCSALKRAYRDTLLVSEDVKIVYLKGSLELLSQRMASRQGHYMKPQMLESQLATLEEPENAVVVDVSGTPAEIGREIRAQLGLA
jgi:gluconokinase